MGDQEPKPPTPGSGRKRWPNTLVVALSREEWEGHLEESIELGLAKPGQTYEEYIASLWRTYGFVCMGHRHRTP